MQALQYSYRAQKDIGLIFGPASYEVCEGFKKPEAFARTAQYSPDGSLFAYAVGTSVHIVSPETHEQLHELQVAAIELAFSPRGTFLSTLERYVKSEDGSQSKNLRVWNATTGEELAAFIQRGTENWNLQFTPNESYAIRLAGELQVFVPQPTPWDAAPKEKLKIEGCTAVFLSPNSNNPHVAVFVPEKNGAPAIIRVHPLISLTTHTSQKSFFKADRLQAKWNAMGTMLLILTHTDVDKSNKSYYGETGLYLLSAAGNYDARITLDKDGPIHDFTWNPSSKEFAVTYGFMPAKTTVFDQRVHAVHEFPAHPHNFISFNPQGRLLALAGFGNLAGKIDIYDRRSWNKVSTIDAPNTTTFEWSPDGRCILTATLSPRLRVDNGVRIWYCTGPLLDVRMVDELYQANWRPFPPQLVPPFPQNIPPPPQPSEQALSTPVKAPSAKPVGAYRPPGARGTAAPSIYKREEDGGPSSGTATPTYGQHGGGGGGSRGGGHHHHHGRDSSPATNGHAHGPNNGPGGGRGRGRGEPRHIPGAAPPSNTPQEQDKSARRKKGRDKKKGGKDEEAAATPTTPAAENNYESANTATAAAAAPAEDGPAPSSSSAAVPLADLAGDGGLDPLQKKIRNLTKKLKAIEELKEKAKTGAKLETTQYKKIETEAEIRKELTTAITQAGGIIA